MKCFNYFIFSRAFMTDDGVCMVDQSSAGPR